MRKIVIRKGKRRYKSDEQILTKIDDCYARSQQLRVEAKAKDDWADDIVRKADISDERAFAGAQQQAKILRSDALALRLKATRLVEVRAKNLGERLSELRTGLLAHCGVTDPSVPAL